MDSRRVRDEHRTVGRTPTSGGRMPTQGRFQIPTMSSALALACLVALGGCERAGDAPVGQSGAEMAWAHAALERNPNLEIVAVDADKGVFTVRDRLSGVVHAVKANELAAAPVAQVSGQWSPHPEAVETPPGAVAEEGAALSADD